MTQLYRKVEVQDRYEDGSWARSYTERFEPVELPTREELSVLINNRALTWENYNTGGTLPDTIADAILELIERKIKEN